MWLQTDCTSQKQHTRKNVLHTSLYFQCFKILVLLLDRLYRLHYHPSAREMERCQRIQDFILICIRHAGKDIHRDISKQTSASLVDTRHSEASRSSQCIRPGVICYVSIYQSHFYQFTTDSERE